MKLATYKDGSRDGQLVVVSRDLSRAHFATALCGRLQAALDDWNFLSPQLEDLSATLNQGKARHAFPFDPRQCMAPLPRAFQWACAEDGGDGEPALRQRAGDELLGPTDDARFAGEAPGVDAEAGVAVIAGDLARGATAAQGIAAVRLVLLAQVWQQRLAGRSPIDAASAFSPVAVTTDELGPAWHGGRLQLPLRIVRNGQLAAQIDAAAMPFHFGQLLARLASARRVRAGSLVGSGALRDPAEGQGAPPASGALRFGDTLRIDMNDADGRSVFGAIEQTVARAP